MDDTAIATRKFQKEMNAGYRLAGPAERPEPQHATDVRYQIAKMLRMTAGSARHDEQGSLYPYCVHSRENGLLESTVEPSISGPRAGITKLRGRPCLPARMAGDLETNEEIRGCFFERMRICTKQSRNIWML